MLSFAAAMIVAVPTAIAMAFIAVIRLKVVGRSPPAPAVDVPLRRLTRCTVIGTHKTQFFGWFGTIRMRNRREGGR